MPARCRRPSFKLGGLRTGLAAALAVAGLSVAGCADLARVTSLSKEPLDVTSPVATQVKTASDAHYKTPRFRDVPPAAAPAPAPAVVRNGVTAVTQQRAQLDTWVDGHPPLTPVGGQDPDTFAANGRATIPAGQIGAPPPDPAGTEEYAARLRALATPPPPPN